MTLIYTKTNESKIRRLCKRFKVPFEDIYKVEIDPTQITIYYNESYDDLNGTLIISCTKVIYDSQLSQYLSHACGSANEAA